MQWMNEIIWYPLTGIMEICDGRQFMEWKTHEELKQYGYPEKLDSETDYEYYWFKWYSKLKPECRNISVFYDKMQEISEEYQAVHDEPLFKYDFPDNTFDRIPFDLYMLSESAGFNQWERRVKSFERVNEYGKELNIWEIDTTYWKTKEQIENMSYPKQLDYEDEYSYNLFKLYCKLKEYYIDEDIDFDEILWENANFKDYRIPVVLDEEKLLRVPDHLCWKAKKEYFQWDRRLNDEPTTCTNEEDVFEVWQGSIKYKKINEPELSYFVLYECMHEYADSLREASERLKVDYEQAKSWAVEYNYHGRFVKYMSWRFSDWGDLQFHPFNERANKLYNEIYYPKLDSEVLDLPKGKYDLYVYVAINPSFKNKKGRIKCKIGETHDWNERRKGLDNPSVPKGFELVLLFGRFKGKFNLEYELHTLFEPRRDAKEYYDLYFKDYCNLRFNALSNLDLDVTGWGLVKCSPEWEQRFEDYLNKQREVQV